MKKLLFILIFIIGCLPVRAQWSAGISAGLDYNIPKINKGYASDVHYDGQFGWDAGIAGRYQFMDWLAVRADIRLSTRNYKMERTIPAVDWVYTKHYDYYLHLPVVADFSFGGAKLRGHLLGGGYVGYWICAKRSGISMEVDVCGSDYVLKHPFSETMVFDDRRDVRFNAGVTAGAGISYAFASHWEAMAECLYLYDLTSSNKSFSVANPRYNKTFDFNLGVFYKF